jgi:hypothetical protein
VPDPVARVLEIVVRFILHPALSARLEILAQVGSPHLDQRPNHRVATWIDSGEASQPCPSNEFQKKRLCLVVACVTDCDSIGGQRLRSTVKEIVPKPAGGVFYRQALGLRICTDVDRLHDDWQTHTPRQVTAKLLVTRRSATKTMVQVGKGDDAEAVLLGEFLEQQGQGDGIGSA